MDYRVEKRDGFRIVGVREPLDLEIEKNFEVVPDMWRKVAEDGTIPKLVSMMNGEPKGILGVSACVGEKEWAYFIAVSSSSPAEGDFCEYEVPAFTWAIFPGKGVCPQAIQELEKRVVTEWLPMSGYEYADGPDIEVYLSPDPNHAEFEVWIPVRAAKEKDC